MPPPLKKTASNGGRGGGEFLWEIFTQSSRNRRLSLIVPGFFGGVRLAYQNFTEMMAMFFCGS